jgi:signal transduction histidine kinase
VVIRGGSRTAGLACGGDEELQGNQPITALADYLSDRHEALLLAWRSAINKDPDLTSGDSLPRSELFDHIPAVLLAFERGLRSAAAGEERTEEDAAQTSAAAHGLQRWKQGYDCREVTREWGKLNECVVWELDRYAKANPNVSLDAMTRARQVWTSLCSAGIEASVEEYFALQQREAAGHVEDLESALEKIRELERQRGETWQQAAHDLRGNLAVVANVTVGLTRHGKRDSSRDDFVRILMRNVTSLHHLLDDVTSLARLQAGRESRQIEPLDVTAIIQPLCEGIRPLAAQHGLYLNCEGPDGFAADGDAVKIRRIGQNLLLNAVKYTHAGGITVTWGDSTQEDPKRWALFITDTGPGFHTDSGQPIASMLESSSEPLSSSEMTTSARKEAASALGKLSVNVVDIRSPRGQTGEGIGLSIVKRLCEMLDATIEIQSVPNVGTTFRILFPRRYTS